MIGVAVLFGCVAAALVAMWILFQLYAPRRSRVHVKPQRSLVSVIVEPAFASRPPPMPPRSRLARGTGGAIAFSNATRAETEKVAPIEYVAR